MKLIDFKTFNMVKRINYYKFDCLKWFLANGYKYYMLENKKEETNSYGCTSSTMFPYQKKREEKKKGERERDDIEWCVCIALAYVFIR